MHIKEYIGKHVHMIGIGGSSMSGLAVMLLKMGIIVSGSDSVESYATSDLKSRGVTVFIGHQSKNIIDADLIVYSAAIGNDNLERIAAKEKGIPEMERSVLLGQLMEGYNHSINVCGTHGKTTTTSMIAQILVDTQHDPTVHIGGQLDYIGGSTRIGGHQVFVAEACEYRRSFLQFHPTIAVITNIEEDHLDYYKDIDDIESAFSQFIQILPPNGVLVGNGDDERVGKLMKECKNKTVSFGLTNKNDWYPESNKWDDLGCASFSLMHKNEAICKVSIGIPGTFNLLHALAAIAAANEVGVSPIEAAMSISRFKAPHRRFEFTGEVCGVKLYTDYGHNPAEMKTALMNASLQPHKKLWAVMQPHTYSRVKSLFSEYIHCCDLADEILITDIFAAREKDPGDIHSLDLVNAISSTGKSVHYTPGFDEAERYLRDHWSPGDLVITMSCGNIHLLNSQIQRHGDQY